MRIHVVSSKECLCQSQKMYISIKIVTLTRKLHVRFCVIKLFHVNNITRVCNDIDFKILLVRVLGQDDGYSEFQVLNVCWLWLKSLQLRVSWDAMNISLWQHIDLECWFPSHYLCVKLVPTVVEGPVDGTEGLKVYIQQLLFSLVCEDCPTEYHQPVLGHWKIGQNLFCMSTELCHLCRFWHFEMEI